MTLPNLPPIKVNQIWQCRDQSLTIKVLTMEPEIQVTIRQNEEGGWRGTHRVNGQRAGGWRFAYDNGHEEYDLMHLIYDPS